ncbi:MAG: hypothetical protein WCJ64_22000 [Rhodospirillaceae bacterium]
MPITIHYFELGQSKPRLVTLEKLRAAFESAGVEFTGDGGVPEVRLRKTSECPPADLLAVQRALAEHGRCAAIAEVRRRWPNISDTVLPATLDRILATSVGQPAPFDTPGDKDLRTRRSRRT